MKKRRKTEENRDKSENLSRISNIRIKGVPEKMMLSTKLLEENSQNWNIWVSRVKDNHCDLQSTCSGSLSRSPIPTQHIQLLPSRGSQTLSLGQLCLLEGSVHHSSFCTGELTPMTGEKDLEPCPKRGTNAGTTCASEQCWVLAKASFQPKPHP